MKKTLVLGLAFLTASVVAQTVVSKTQGAVDSVTCSVVEQESVSNTVAGGAIGAGLGSMLGGMMGSSSVGGLVGAGLGAAMGNDTRNRIYTCELIVNSGASEEVVSYTGNREPKVGQQVLVRKLSDGKTAVQLISTK